MRTKKDILDSIVKSEDYKLVIGNLSPEDKKKLNELLSGQILPFLHKLELSLQFDDKEDDLDYSYPEGE